MTDIGKIFKLRDGGFMLVTSYDSKLNSVDEEMPILCGPTVDAHQWDGANVHESWAYFEGFPEKEAGYVPPTIRKALESFRAGAPK